MIANLAAGFLFGLITSMPIAGPVSIFIFQRGLSGRWRAGLGVASGAAVAEAGWCLVALLGAGQIMSRWLPAEWMAKAVGAVILLALGVFFVTRKKPVTEIDEELISSFNPWREFILGFSLVAGNLAMPLNWLGFLTIAVGYGFDPFASSPLTFIIGVAMGIITWFAILLKLLDHFRTRVAPSRIQWFMRAMGMIMIIMALMSFFRDSPMV